MGNMIFKLLLLHVVIGIVSKTLELIAIFNWDSAIVLLTKRMERGFIKM